HYLLEPDTLPANFPSIRTEVLGETAPGYVFLTVSRDIPNVGYYIMMLNNDGTPFYYKELPNDYAYDFKMQPNGKYSYAQFLHHHTFTGGGEVIHKVMDNSFTVIDSFQMGNGYIAEAHDFQLLPNGHSLLFAYDLQIIDLSELGGYPNAKVAQSVIQELDQNKNVIFQWRSSDYYDFDDSYSNRLTREAFDPIHVNSIILDNDGNILITPNGLSEVTKISRQTGEMIWRLGGKNNQFQFIGQDAEFSRGIHNVSRLENGDILLFDNSPRNSTTPSRAVEYELDEVNKTATLVWSYAPDSPPVLAFFRGSAQRLPNGNTIIGWGSASDNDSIAVTEVTSDGTEVFKLFFEHEGLSSYRAFRFPFDDGQPSHEFTEFEVFQGNTYVFDSTGITITIDYLVGVGYNSITVKRYEFAPYNPMVNGKAPLIVPKRITVSVGAIDTLKSDIKFDINEFNVYANEADEYAVYYRSTENNGYFEPLPTIFNSATNQIIGETPKLAGPFIGEFILGKADLESMIFTPKLFAPNDAAKVNQELSVDLRWTPIGFVNYYALQVVSFPENFIIEEDSLVEALYTLDNLEDNTTYVWRVKSINDAGESEWSDPFSFTTVAPFIKIETPNGGEEWQRGLEYFITWDDVIEEDVEIHLLSETGIELDTLGIHESDGGFKWEIDPFLDEGMYKIRVQSIADPNLYSISAETFLVADSVSSVHQIEKIADDFALYQNYPNPFNPSTTIRYSVPVQSQVKITIYNSIGENIAELVNLNQSAGSYLVTWEAQNVSSGIYFYSIEAVPSDGLEFFKSVKKMILLK
ncbi:MAG: aryl-sulfate sulfotransferase, partial [Ignavibacteria bacterium]|nr:aryl-sulfate sulfotransferase [Ignavibacteria bacterium]